MYNYINTTITLVLLLVIRLINDLNFQLITLNTKRTTKFPLNCLKYYVNCLEYQSIYLFFFVKLPKIHPSGHTTYGAHGPRGVQPSGPLGSTGRGSQGLGMHLAKKILYFIQLTPLRGYSVADFIIFLTINPNPPSQPFPVGGNRRTRRKSTTFGRVLTNSSHLRPDVRYRARTYDLSGGRTEPPNPSSRLHLSPHIKILIT